MNEIICTYPPIPRKVCYNCGWSWEGEQEKVIRVPFGGSANTATTFVGGNANTSTTIEVKTSNDLLNADYHNYEDLTVSAFEQSACVNCSNNSKNGGSGVCHCTLGQPKITY
jgi:hypothetical protein